MDPRKSLLEKIKGKGPQVTYLVLTSSTPPGQSNQHVNRSLTRSGDFFKLIRKLNYNQLNIKTKNKNIKIKVVDTNRINCFTKKNIH